MKRRLRRMLLMILAPIAILAIGGLAWVQQPRFGALPEGDRRATVERSPNYVDGEFRNLVPTPMFAEDRSFLSVLVSNLVTSAERLRPESRVPSVRTDLRALDRDEDVVVWFGHSSLFVQLGGKRLLIDPVFSEGAAPVPWANRAFAGSSPYVAADMPGIDYLLITHDHWDHLDHPSVVALAPKVDRVIAGLGIGAHLERWGYPDDKIIEGDWNTTLNPDDELTVHILPARHYSGRSLDRNQSLWVAFVLETSERRIFVSGDTGYGPHLGEIGRRFGGFDLAVLDSGQYDPRWPYIHMSPEEAVRAARDLRATAILPAHVGRFAIAKHPWDEPFRRLAAASEGAGFRLLTPIIGERVVVGADEQQFDRWWKALPRRVAVNARNLQRRNDQ